MYAYVLGRLFVRRVRVYGCLGWCSMYSGTWRFFIKARQRSNIIIIIICYGKYGGGGWGGPGGEVSTVWNRLARVPAGCVFVVQDRERRIKERRRSLNCGRVFGQRLFRWNGTAGLHRMRRTALAVARGRYSWITHRRLGRLRLTNRLSWSFHRPPFLADRRHTHDPISAVISTQTFIFEKN